MLNNTHQTPLPGWMMKDSLQGLLSLLGQDRLMQAFLVLLPTLACPEMDPDLGLKFCRHAPYEWWGHALIWRCPIIGQYMYTPGHLQGLFSVLKYT